MGSDEPPTIISRMAVENNEDTARAGGVTGCGFPPGQSGNPGGRPKGLARRVRELVGSDGAQIAAFFYNVMMDPVARLADRMEAARWLADRGFGKAAPLVDLDAADPTRVEVERKRSPARFLEILEAAAEMGWMPGAEA